ncbi:MAG: aminotransferase class V-fold PLP-dependent enzyme [Myxococcales bacterium]|nr:aminotransferase class V-fold PLP-dependent enzyme [Myxococcales bacterium]
MAENGHLYFDNAATSYPKPAEVYAALDRYAREEGGSAGRGAHARAVAGSRLLFNLREELAALLGGHPDRLVLTRHATEALNLALFSLIEPGAVVAHGALEHNAVMRPLQHLAATRGVRLLEIPGDADGRLTPDALRRALAAEPIAAVVTLHGSNVNGAIQDLAALGELCRAREIPFIVDAAQTAGCWPIDQEAMGIDALCVTGHKSLLGPTGVGALLLAARVAERVAPLVHGGTGSESEKETMPDFLPDRLEAGTPNTFGAAGLLAGVRYVTRRTVAAVRRHEDELRGRLRERLRAIPGLRVLAADGDALAVVSVVGAVAPSDLAFLLSERYGIATRAGLHCAPRAHRTLGTLAMGALRLAPGPLTPPAAVDEVAAALHDLLGALA